MKQSVLKRQRKYWHQLPGWPPREEDAISVDRPVADAAKAAQFLQKLAEFLENPVRMLV